MVCRFLRNKQIFARHLPHSSHTPKAFRCLPPSAVDLTKTPSDATSLGRTSSEVFVMLVVVILHSLLFFIHWCFYISEAREGLHQLWALPWLLSIAFAFPSTASATVLNGAFFTHRRFLPYAPSPIFLTQPAFIKTSLRAGNSFLEFAGLHADPCNTHLAHLFVWFTAIHNLDIQKNSFLNCAKYYHKLLVIKSLV